MVASDFSSGCQISLFAKLQALARGGGSAFASGAFGSAAAVQYVNDFCTYVDHVDPASPAGKAIDVAVAAEPTVVNSGKVMGEVNNRAKAECAASENCTALAEMGSHAMEYASVQGAKAKDFVSEACMKSKSIEWMASRLIGGNFGKPEDDAIDP